jgi:phosphoglycerate dehydrogenase-like enzyme
MKQGAYFVSCGSGGVIDEAALARLIRIEHLAGAALDTFEWEPVTEENPLLMLARQGYNVLLTPHIASGDNETNRREMADIYTNILRHQRGDFLLYRVV